MLLADLKRTKRLVLFLREALILQRACGAVGLCPGEVEAGDASLAFGDPRTLPAEFAGRADGLTMGKVHFKCIGTEPFGAVRRRADRTGEHIPVGDSLFQCGRADI